MQTDAPTTGLKACPFCGGEAYLREGHREHWRAECTKCGATIGQFFANRGRAEDQRLATEAWNTRTPALETQGAHEGVIEACADPVAFLRDVDGTGSLHVCAQGDVGAMPVYDHDAVSLSAQTAEALDAWAFNVMLECAGSGEKKIDVVMGGAILDLRDLHKILAALSSGKTVSMGEAS